VLTAYPLCTQLNGHPRRFLSCDCHLLIDAGHLNLSLAKRLIRQRNAILLATMFVNFEFYKVYPKLQIANGNAGKSGQIESLASREGDICFLPRENGSREKSHFESGLLVQIKQIRPLLGWQFKRITAGDLFINCNLQTKTR
jgi:hypothetical protein